MIRNSMSTPRSKANCKWFHCVFWRLWQKLHTIQKYVDTLAHLDWQALITPVWRCANNNLYSDIGMVLCDSNVDFSSHFNELIGPVPTTTFRHCLYVLMHISSVVTIPLVESLYCPNLIITNRPKHDKTNPKTILTQNLNCSTHSKHAIIEKSVENCSLFSC